MLTRQPLKRIWVLEVQRGGLWTWWTVCETRRDAKEQAKSYRDIYVRDETRVVCFDRRN